MNKFEQVDLIASLEAIMKTNTVHYQSDFDIDKALMMRAANSPDPADKMLLWLSRPSGTQCYKEQEVFQQGTTGYNTWKFYAEQTSDPILAYGVKITGMEDGKIVGNLYELNYPEHVKHVIKEALPVESVVATLKDGTEQTVPFHDYFAGRMNFGYEQVERIAHRPTEPDKLDTLLHQEQWNRDKLRSGDMEKHIAKLSKHTSKHIQTEKGTKTMEKNFNAFVEEVQKKVKEQLPEELKDAAVTTTQVEKLNGNYTGLTIRQDNDPIAATHNLDKYFEDYQNGRPMDDIVGSLVSYAGQEAEMKPKVEMSMLTNYEEAKEQLFIRVSSAERNADMLQNVPHKNVEDMAITYHIMVNHDSNGLASGIVNENLMERFGVSLDQLHDDAVKNTPNLFPTHFQSMESVMREMISTDMRNQGMDEADIQDTLDMMLSNVGESPELYVLTNDQKLHGAATLFYPETMDMVAEQMKGDYFILPSSTHEVLVMPDDGCVNAQELKAMVTEVNDTQVAPEDILTYEVYHYDATEKVFEKAESFDERQAAKKQEKTKEKDEKSLLKDLKQKQKSVEAKKKMAPVATAKHRTAEASI